MDTPDPIVAPSSDSDVNKLPAIEEIESSPDFQSLSLEDQQYTLKGYFDEKEQLAKTEDEYNETIKERADRELLDLHRAYKAKFPEGSYEKTEDSFKKNIESDPVLKGKHDRLQTMYGELDYNVNKSLAEVKEYKADDMEDKNRALKVKPFLRNGKKGFNVVYPDGFQESILQDGIENVNQLTDFFQKERLGRFRGKREGWFDQATADQGEELNLIRDKIRNTASSTLAGLGGDILKGAKGVYQGAEVMKIDSITKALTRNREAKETIAILDANIKRRENFENGSDDRMDIARMKRERQEAQDLLDNKNAGIGKSRIVEDLNPLSEGLSMSPEEAEPQLKEAYSNLAKSIISSEGIKGSRVAADVEDDIRKRAEAAKKLGLSSDEDLSFLGYFKENPTQLPAYIMSVAAQALPDMAMSYGGAALGGAAGSLVGSPVKGAMAAGQAIGFAREYSASLLTELQVRAAKEGRQLTEPGVAESYLNDPEFMEATRAKASKRAGAISVGEAVAAGLFEKIARGTQTAFAKALTTGAVSVAEEMIGEGAAQAIAEDKFSLRQVIEEGFGAMGSAGGSAVRSATSAVIDKVSNPSKLALEANKAKWQNEMFPKNDFSDEPLAPAGAPLPERDLTTGRKLPGEDSSYKRIYPNSTDVAQFESEDVKTSDRLPEIKDFQLTESPDADVSTPENLEKNGLSLLDRMLNVLNKRGSDIENSTIPDENGNPVLETEADIEDDADTMDRKAKATAILSDPMFRKIYDILADPKMTGESYDRIMRDFKASNPDQDASGRLMSAIGLDPSDANKRILTNILGNFWGVNQRGEDLPKFVTQGYVVSAALDSVINEMMGIDSYYEMPFKDLRKVTPDSHILIQTSQDSEIPEYGGWTVSGSAYGPRINERDSNAPTIPSVKGMSATESVRRLEEALSNAKNVRTSKYDPSFKDKVTESERLDRPDFKPLAFSDSQLKGKSAKEITAILKEKFPNGFLIKSRSGEAGKGIFGVMASYEDDPTHKKYLAPDEIIEEQIQSAINKNKSEDGDLTGYNDAYVEPYLEIPESARIEHGTDADFDEKRIHVMVDSNGKAYAFRNMSYDKGPAGRADLRNAIDTEKESETGVKNPEFESGKRNRESLLFSVPLSPNDPTVKALQTFAEKHMSKPVFANQIFGLDMAMVELNGVLQPHIFEANVSTHGMSGFLGEGLAQAEMISELTGRPSVIAGMYNLAKLDLTREQLNAISSAIKERITHEYKDNPASNEVIQRGEDIYNPYIPSDKWLSAMTNAFVTAPIEFLRQLYSAIRNVYRDSVDKYFKQKYSDIGSVTAEVTEPKSPEYLELTRYVPNKGETFKLRDYIAKLRANPQLTENYRQILNYVLQNANNKFLDNVTVERNSDHSGSYYQTNTGRIVMGDSASLHDAVEEVMHSVTADFIDVNAGRMLNAFGAKTRYDRDNYRNELKTYYESLDPSTREDLLQAGVSGDFIDAIPVYLSLLEKYGVTKESVWDENIPLPKGIGIDSSAYANHNAGENSKTGMPYHAINMHEMMAGSISNERFQNILRGMPSIITNAKNLWQELMRIIARILHIPVNKDNLLFDALDAVENVIKSPDNYYFSDRSEMGTDYNAAKKKDTSSKKSANNTEQTKPAKVTKIRDGNGRFTSKALKDSDTSQATKDIASDPKLTPAQQETLAKSAQLEKLALRFSKLKKQYASVLVGIKLNNKDPMRSLKEAREKIADHLSEQIDASIEDGGMDDAEYDGTNEATKKKSALATKKKWAALLTENKLMAGHYAEELGLDPSISENHMKFITNALGHILNKTADVMNLTTNEIKYYNNIIESFSDGGPPAGMKRVLSESFIEEQLARAIELADDGPNLGLMFANPISRVRNEALFGLFSGKLGTQASFASEAAYLAPAQNARKFVNDLTGVMRDNINDQQLEQDLVSTQFAEYVKTQFPSSIRPIQRNRTGLVARLTQYNASHPSASPVSQLTERYNQLIASLPVMRDMQPLQAQLTEEALTQIFGTQFPTLDISKLGPDENAIIAYMENKLSHPEKNVLIKVREIAQAYLPSLQTVKALTRTSALDVYENFTHDVNVIHREPGEQHILQNFSAMSDILQDRETIKPDERPSYPEVDIVAIADAQIRAATYEKYTGVERYLLKQSLGEKSPLVKVFDGGSNIDKNKLQPVTNRLRKIVTSYHNAMVRAQPGTGPVMGIVEGLTNVVMGSNIWGGNQFVQNLVSSSVARLTLSGLGREAMSNMFVYDTHSKELFNWIKSTNPTQFNRTSEYDTLNERENRWNRRNTWRASRDVHDSLWKSLLKAARKMPKEFIDGYSKQVLRRLSNLSNAIPERRNAFAIYTAAYLHYAKQNGTVTDVADFFAKGKPFDKNAATQANDFVSRSLGYAPDKASKGEFWNGSTRTKQVLSKTFFAYRQQATGMSTNFQNEFATAARLHAVGNHKEAAKAWAMSASLLTSAISFRVAAIAMRSIMIGGAASLALYFNAKDDEDKKRKLLEAQAKYNRTSKRNNLRDLHTETAMMLFPVASSAFAFEAASAMAADTGDIIIEPKDPNNLLKGYEIKHKQNIKDELEHVNNEISKLNKLIKNSDMLGVPTLDHEDRLDKLESYKDYLSEQTKFAYFPKQGLKAFFMSLGGYGMAAEEAVERVQTFVDQDLTSKEKLELRNMEDNEFAYHDPIAGLNYPVDMLNNVGRYIQNFSQFEKRKEDRVPTSLWVQSILKLGMNPSVVVERGRKAAAKESLQKEKEKQRRLERNSRRLLGTDPLKKETMTLEETENLQDFLKVNE